MRNVPASGGRKDVFRFGALAGQPVVDIVGKEREDLIHEPHKTLPLDLAPDATKEKAGFRLPVAPHLLEERSTTFLPIAPHRLEPTERDTVGHNDEPIPAKATRQASVGRRAANRQSEEHTSELQSRENLVCRLLLEK